MTIGEAKSAGVASVRCVLRSTPSSSNFPKDAEKATEPLFVADRNNPDDMRLLSAGVAVSNFPKNTLVYMRCSAGVAVSNFPNMLSVQKELACTR